MAVEIEPPEVLSTVPPLIVKVPAILPSAFTLLMFSVPALSVVPPEKVFDPDNVSAPDPSFVIEIAPPAITPPTVKLLPLTVICRLPLGVIAPLPKFKLLVPANAKSLFQDWILLLVSVMAPPLVLSIAPPAIVRVPVPIAVELLILRLPAERVVPPE